jgi:hypothetical protein
MNKQLMYSNKCLLFKSELRRNMSKCKQLQPNFSQSERLTPDQSEGLVFKSFMFTHCPSIGTNISK